MIRRPRHPGIILKLDYIKPLNIDVIKLTITLDIPLITLWGLLDGKVKVTSDIANKLGKLWNTTPEFWLNLQQKYDLWSANNKLI